MSLEKVKDKNKLQFLLSIPYFQDVQENYFFSLLDHFQKKKFRRNDVIFKEGEFNKYLYIIKKGEIKLSKNLLQTNLTSEKIESVTSLSKIRSKANNIEVE